MSYEVGGDVFSLQELEHCVLRGRLPRPSLKDFPKRFAPLPPEADDHYIYSLGKVISSLSFFLRGVSTASIMCSGADVSRYDVVSRCGFCVMSADSFERYRHPQ